MRIDHSVRLIEESGCARAHGVLHRAGGAAQRRYEALRAYFTEEMPAAEVADRFGYSTASVRQMAMLLRTGRLSLFAETRPAPKGPEGHRPTPGPGAGAARRRAQRHRDRHCPHPREGMPVSAQTVWLILDAEGLPRLPRRDEGRCGLPARLAPVIAANRIQPAGGLPASTVITTPTPAQRQSPSVARRLPPPRVRVVRRHQITARLRRQPPRSAPSGGSSA